MRPWLAAACLSALVAPAAAQEPCALPYAAFEFAVPHIDLDACPAEVEAEGGFCRASIAGDALHVFVFDAEGDQCLLRLLSFDEEAFTLTLR